jgi:hypothetical protein
MLPIMNGYVVAMFSGTDKSLWPPLLVINCFIVIMWSISHWFHLKRNKELQQLSAL